MRPQQTEFVPGQRLTLHQVLELGHGWQNEYHDGVADGQVATVEWVPVGTWEKAPPVWESCPVPCPPMCDQCDRGFVETLVAHLDTSRHPVIFFRVGERMFLEDGQHRYDAAIRRRDGQVMAFVFDMTGRAHHADPIAMSGGQRQELRRQRQDRRIRELEQELASARQRAVRLEQVPKGLTAMLDEHDRTGSIPVPTLRIALRAWLGTWYDQGSPAHDA